MKAKDLIEVLKLVDPEAIVITTTDNPELEKSLVPVTSVIVGDLGQIELKHGTDEFDDSPILVETWKMDGGNRLFVKL